MVYLFFKKKLMHYYSFALFFACKVSLLATRKVPSAFNRYKMMNICFSDVKISGSHLVCCKERRTFLS
uniref:Uncharacterized protein n=1 Tax=Arundo donax TaxID=35708 RepID=A0A0A9CJN6_ARUDO